jgi:hypothetical protein
MRLRLVVVEPCALLGLVAGSGMHLLGREDHVLQVKHIVRCHEQAVPNSAAKFT